MYIKKSSYNMLTIFLSFKILDSLCLHVFKKKHHNIMQADHHETATPRPFILSVPSLHKGNKGPVKITFFAGPPLAASRNLKAMALSYNWSISHIPRESQTTKPHRLCLPHLDPKACIFSPQLSRPPGACWVGLNDWKSDLSMLKACTAK